MGQDFPGNHSDMNSTGADADADESHGDAAGAASRVGS